MNRIVLDTNCLLASISSKSPNFAVWKGLHEGAYILCLSNEILEEYNEIIAKKTNIIVANSVINSLLKSRFVEFVNPYFRFRLIKDDPDDNKFVDCAIAANASYIVSEDKHFCSLKEIKFPHVEVIKLASFVELLK